MGKEIFGYARVSTKEQNLTVQLIKLAKYVPKIENIFSDKQSGKDFDRPGYKLVNYQRLKSLAWGVKPQIA